MSTPTESHLILTENLFQQIECFQLSNYDWSCNLVGICLPKKIVLAVLKFDDNNTVEFLKLKEIQHDIVSNYISFAPETSLTVLPANVVFAVAYNDFNVRVYKSNLEINNTVQILSGHTNYINEISWQPDGRYMASVSDDHSCIVWECRNDFEIKSTFYLTAAGISVKWNTDLTDKILIGQKNGLIRYYNVHTEQALLSIDTKKMPLMSIDWSEVLPQLVASISAGELAIWDLKKPCLPVHAKQIHENGGMIVKFSPMNEHIVATIGGTNMLLKVYCTRTNAVLLEQPLKLYGGLSWHFNLPILVAAQDSKLKFWSIS